MGHRCKNQMLFRLEVPPKWAEEEEWGFEDEAEVGEG